MTKPNAQYNVAASGSLADRVGDRVRRQMFDRFLEHLKPLSDDKVLDIGVTSDQTYAASNYFEFLYPFKENITASGIDDAAFLERLCPGVRFLQADALRLPFRDDTFDLVHSSAVLEHVGSIENQSKMISECLRVARRGICLTTPNRWFPLELHTHLPFVHWLPKRACRSVFRALGYEFFAEERNLNLMSRSDLSKIVAHCSGWRFQIVSAKLLGLPSNLMLFAARETRAADLFSESR
jgi:hypothetical protein